MMGLDLMDNERDAATDVVPLTWTAFTDLPMAYGEPPIKGLLRASAADFQVDEELDFGPDGEGEHQLLRLRKTDANTEWVAKQLASFRGAPVSVVGYAGMKDRHAVTTQWFSVQVPLSKDPDWSSLDVPGVEILEVHRHGRKLRRGALSGNRFRITLRAVTGDLEALEERLHQIGERGVPNYFGAQRFGNREGNLYRADALFRGEIRRVKRHLKGIWLSAARSQLFNQVLASRVERDDWDRPIPGDRMQLAGSRSHFLAIIVDDELQQRTRTLDIHPTGPLWGEGDRLADDECAALEDQALAGFAFWRNGLVNEGLRQERRALRMPVDDLEWGSGADDSIEIGFRLGVGCFATAFLREIVDWEEPG